MRIFATGGAGYIGSHTVIELIRAGHDVVVADNLHNSSPVAMQRVAQIVGREVPFYQADIRDRGALERIFEETIASIAVFTLPGRRPWVNRW